MSDKDKMWVISVSKEKGEKTAAILPIKKYEELIEDFHDLAVVAERRDEPATNFKKLKERLRKNGSGNDREKRYISKNY